MSFMMSNWELSEAIEQTSRRLTATGPFDGGRKPLVEHLEALLKERQRRAEERVTEPDVHSAVDHHRCPNPKAKGGYHSCHYFQHDFEQQKPGWRCDYCRAFDPADGWMFGSTVKSGDLSRGACLGGDGKFYTEHAWIYGSYYTGLARVAGHAPDVTSGWKCDRCGKIVPGNPEEKPEG